MLSSQVLKYCPMLGLLSLSWPQKPEWGSLLNPQAPKGRIECEHFSVVAWPLTCSVAFDMFRGHSGTGFLVCEALLAVCRPVWAGPPHLLQGVPSSAQVLAVHQEHPQSGGSMFVTCYMMSPNFSEPGFAPL